MKKEELKGFLNEMGFKDNCTDIVENAIDSFSLDPIAIKKLVGNIANLPLLMKDAIYWNKFTMFIMGVRQIEEDIGQGINLSNKLFGDPKNRKENGMRLLGYIDKADSELKVNYYINATRSLLMGLIDITTYFRVMKALSETLNEDLEYLAEIATSASVLKGNIQIFALERSGLVIQAGINANESIEAQKYAVSSLGRLVDQYAISLENEERQKYYKNGVSEAKLEVGIQYATTEEVKAIFSRNTNDAQQ